uniref:CD276 antigen n=1 Tax=Canis lupus familiaris TaxID=9615 RepID=A0A8C0SZS2_CANLF
MGPSREPPSPTPGSAPGSVGDGPKQNAPSPPPESGVYSGVRGGDGLEQSGEGAPQPWDLPRGQGWGMGPSRAPPPPPGICSGVRAGWARAGRGGQPWDLPRVRGGDGPEQSGAGPPPGICSGAAPGAGRGGPEPSAPSPPPPPPESGLLGELRGWAGSGRAQASAGGRAAGPIPPLGRSPAAFPGPRLPRPARPSAWRGRPDPHSGRAWRRRPVAAPRPGVPRPGAPGAPAPRAESRAAGAAFHHGEPSCQLPLRKMLRRASADVGVRLAAALAALWFCITGAVEVQVPEDPVVALVGTDATLRCSFSPEPGFSLAQLNLIWQLTDTKQLVHSFAEGRDQGSAYANRTALFPDLLAQGNASLRLQRVRVADEGSFTCFVSIRDFGSAAVSLQVAAPYSKPSMTLEPSKDLRPGDTVTITCSSYRGYPEAEVLWQDGQGAPLTGNVTTSQMANEQGLFDVRSVLRVVLGANGTYSCLVRNPVLQQDARGSVTITPHRSPTGAVEVQVPEDPVVALVGTDATLCCSFSPEPGFSLAQLNLIWQLTDTKQLVHSFAEGRDQGSAYANRTALFPDLLAQGNASLRLQRVRVADEGSFTCFVSIRDFGSAAVSLQVAAPYSKPSMTLEPSKDLRPGDTVTITCSSYRGYPEAEVLWQDGQGAPLTGNVTTSQMANEQGLFDVRSVLRVVLGANGTYSCLVRNPVLQQDAHGSVTITGQPMTFPPEALWVTVGLSVCLVALLVALAFVCWRKIKQSCEEENAGAEDQDGDGEGSKTALRPLKHSESKEDDGQEIA